REAELLARVDHPGVVRVHEFGRDPQGPYLVLDLAEGEDLHACYPHGCTAERATELVVALASALEAVHAQGVIHRDLKPQNVLLRPDGSPLLLDFGLARDLDGSRLTKSHEILGTPGYLSPEQVRGGGKACDARADVYGLGGVLFFLLTGRPPFDAAGIVPLLHAVLHDPPAWGDARVPAELRA
ncbi:MAG: serine/threonine protein kinase, partial [Planctomycetes bacterium]|nr:serine/threonine protein kinase [Planctomycetota bacterium]